MIPTRKIYKKYDEETAIKRSNIFSQIQFYKNLPEIKWVLLSSLNFDIDIIDPGHINSKGFQEYDNLLVSKDNRKLKVKYYFRKSNSYGLEYRDRYDKEYPDYLANSASINLNMLDNDNSYYDIYIYGILDNEENLEKVSIFNWNELRKLWYEEKIIIKRYNDIFSDNYFGYSNEDEKFECPVVDTYYNENYLKSYLCIPLINNNITRKFPELILYKRGF